MSTRLVVGLDAGGSTTHLLAEHSPSAEQIERQGPGANPNRIGVEDAADVLVGLIEAAIPGGPAVGQLSVCAGVAGAGRSDEQQALTEALHAAVERSGRTVRVEVVHDAVVALDAAYDTGSGLVVIAGTGSVVLGRTTDGDLQRTGGWGPVLGDDGSGYALGRAGLRAVAEAFDGGKETALQPRVCERFDVEGRDDLLRTVYRDNVDVAAVAPLVVEAAADGDAVAAALLTSQVGRLTKQVEWLLARTDAMAPRITLVGGLLQNDHYAQCLHENLDDRFPEWTVTQLQNEPALGALRRARRLQPDPRA